MSLREFSAISSRLALGIDLVDPVRDRELAYPARIDIEYGIPHRPAAPARRYSFAQVGSRLPVGLVRQGSGRYALRYHAGIRDHVDLRIYDLGRHYVPRRLRVPLVDLADVLAIEENETPNFHQSRVRRPALFPGAAYHVASMATALRGRVLRDGEPMPWVWVEARLEATDTVVGRARGDDRGEFLLLLQPESAPAGELDDPLDVQVRISGPNLAPSPANLDLPSEDPWWDLPLEILPAPGVADTVSPGHVLPAGFTTPASAIRSVEFPLGRQISSIQEADFDFAP